MPLVWVAAGVALLLVLLLVVRLDAFFSLLLTALAVGLLGGMTLVEVLASVLAGVGSTLGSVVLVVTFGAMLGRLLDGSGAAHTITYRLTGLFGARRVQYALLVAGFVVGLPMVYNARFLVLIPLVYAIARATGLSLLHLGIPLSASLSVAHGYLLPHPAPTFISVVYGADVNRALAFGLVPVLPACLLGGILLSKRFAHLHVEPPAQLSQERPAGGDAGRGPRPGLPVSVCTALLTVLLMLAGAAVDLALGTSGLDPFRDGARYPAALAAAVPDPRLAGLVTLLKFLANANVALLAAVLLGLYTLGVRRGRPMEALMTELAGAAGSVAVIVLIIAAGGAFSQVLKDGGVAEYIKGIAAGTRANPLVAAFAVAAAIRAAVGSATVAAMTAAGVMAPVALAGGVRPELMVLATGSGSLMFSHFNDVGFWMFKEYYNVTVKQTFAIWSVMECVVALTGLAAALLMHAVL